MTPKRIITYAAIGLAALLLAFGIISPEQFGAAFDALMTPMEVSQ